MKRSHLVIVCVLALLVSGSVTAAFAVSPEQIGPEGSMERELFWMAMEVPGFGGLYYDEEGYPNVYLTDTASAEALERLGGEVRVREGDFDFIQLQGWRNEARSIFGLAGVVTLDVDERSNRVRIGVDRASVIPSVRRQLLLAGVPSAAVVIEERPPIFPMVTLREQVRPVPGGVQIHFGNFLCTLGFNAVRGNTFGFVTNSHCTNTQGGVEGTQYFQPLSPAAIGTEVADPSYRNCGRGRRCRFSDSSFAAYSSSSLGDAGAIARTTSRGALTGSLTIDPSNPTFTVTATGAPAAGQQVNKIGRTTGWTFGTVTDTCVDVSVSGSRLVQQCQDIVTAGVGSGDSGSPVFSWSGSGSNVTLNGILWGGDSAGTLFVYSPWANIVRNDELGPLNPF